MVEQTPPRTSTTPLRRDADCTTEDESEIRKSREHEMHVYLVSMKGMYKNALLQNGEIYEIAASLTQEFCSITPRSILADSRIIKILRYAIAPSISQMKFGQFFGIPSIGNFE